MGDNDLKLDSMKEKSNVSNITDAIEDSKKKHSWKLPIFSRKKKSVEAKQVKTAISSTHPELNTSRKPRPKLWIGIIAFVALMIIGIGGYSFFAGDSYPENIYGSPRVSIDDESAKVYNECFDTLGDGSEETCVQGIGSVTYGNEAEMDDVVRVRVTKGISSHKANWGFYCKDPLIKCENNVIIDGKMYENQKMIYWYYSDDEFVKVKQWGTAQKGLDSPVVKHFMSKYPPVAY